MKKRHLVLGRMTGGISFILLLPLPFIAYAGNEAWLLPSFLVPFLFSLLLSAIIGRTGFYFSSPSSSVTFIWIYGSLLFSMPFLLSGEANFMASLFESISGLTTTGLSILSVENLPKTLLLYRAILQYVGGLGFIMMILLFFRGKDEAELYDSEGHPDRVRPSIRGTAYSIALVYLLLMVVGTILYCMVKMNFLDALVHSMCALSTGGFSNRMLSIGDYDSLPVEVITSILTMLGATDFLLLLLLLRGRRRAFFRSSEPRAMFVLALSGTILVLICMECKGFSFPYSLRVSAFNVISALTTTGFSTVDFKSLPEEAVFVLVIMMAIGGGEGSTAGGIKLKRIVIAVKSTLSNIKKRLSQEGSVIVEMISKGRERSVIGEEDKDEAFSFIFLHILLSITGALAISLLEGSPILHSLFETVSALSTVGLSIGVATSHSSPVTLSVLMALMLLGRLEIIVVLDSILGRRRRKI